MQNLDELSWGDEEACFVPLVNRESEFQRSSGPKGKVEDDEVSFVSFVVRPGEVR